MSKKEKTEVDQMHDARNELDAAMTELTDWNITVSTMQRHLESGCLHDFWFNALRVAKVQEAKAAQRAYNAKETLRWHTLRVEMAETVDTSIMDETERTVLNAPMFPH